MKEKSLKGAVSLVLENLKQFHRNVNHRFHGGSYFGCPICVVRNNYVYLNDCSALRAAGNHSWKNEKMEKMGALDAFFTGYMEEMWLSNELELDPKIKEQYDLWNLYITKSFKDVLDDTFQDTFFPDFARLWFYSYQDEKLGTVYIDNKSMSESEISDIINSFRYMNDMR
jgi:hypothetical protein